MNNALSMLALGQMQAGKMLIFTVPGEKTPTIVNIDDLQKLYIETKIELNELKEKMNGIEKKSNKSSKRQESIQTEQQVEKLQKEEVRRPRRKGLHNNEAADEVLPLPSRKSKRR
jgi:hypothetical protein